MPLGIVIIGWRNDSGAYLLDGYPQGIEVDDQDLMQIYNLHRFRATDPNFQFMKLGADLNIASFYSGFGENFISKPNYCVTLLLKSNEKAIEYERVLVKATNNLLRHLTDDDFEEYMEDIFHKINSKDFDAIKIEREPTDEEPAEEEVEISEERQIFENLVAAADEIEDGDASAAAEFDQAASVGADPFGGAGADPFAGSTASGGSSSDPFADNPFAENPFSEAGPKPASPTPADANPFAENPFAAGASSTQPAPSPAPKPVTPTPGPSPGPQKPTGPSTPQLIKDVKVLDMKKPSAPAGQAAPEARIEYLEELVTWFEKKLSVLSKIAKKLQDAEQEMREKDELIGKLMLLVS